MTYIYHTIGYPTPVVGEGYSLFTTYTKHFKSDTPLNENLEQRMISAAIQGKVLNAPDLESITDPRLVKRKL